MLDITGFEGFAKADSELLTVKIMRRLQTVWKASIGEFVKAVAREIAVDTGMSAGSLVPLAYEVRVKSYLQYARIKRSVGNKYKGGPGFPGTNTNKTFGLGVQFGERAYSITYPDSKDNPIFEFSFDIVVFQHALKENGLGRGSNFPKTMDAGYDAFEAYWEEESAYVIGNEFELMVR